MPLSRCRVAAGASCDVTPQYGDTESHIIAAGTSSTFSFEDIDPFADRPPRPSSSSLGGSGISNNGTLGPPPIKFGLNPMTSTSNNMNFQTSNSWSVKSQGSAESASLNLGSSSSTAGSLNGGLDPQNSLGFLKQSHEFPAANVSYADMKSADLGSIFASKKNEQIAPKLAPPPSTAVGRGRERGRGRGAASTTRSIMPSHILSSHPFWICWGSPLPLPFYYQGDKLLFRLYIYVTWSNVRCWTCVKEEIGENLAKQRLLLRDGCTM